MIRGTRRNVGAKAATILTMLVALGAWGQDSLSPEDPAGRVKAPAPISQAVSFGQDGLLFASEDTSTKLRVHGYIQADGRFFSSNLKDQNPDSLLFRRIRPLFEGTLFNTLDFRFMPDFGQNNPQIQEVYVEFRAPAVARLRLGKFKTPLGLEALRSDREVSFAERSLASDLLPLREVGAQVSGALLRESVTYAIGYFTGTSDGANGSFQWRSSNEAVARIFLQPFVRARARPLQGLGIGAGGSAAVEHGALPRLRTVGQNTFFKYSATAAADGQHNRLSPQAWYYWGPLGIMGEYTISSQDVSNHLHTRRLRNRAWQSTVSFMLTGEKNSYAGVRPHYAFEPQRGIRHIGGWELAGRYSRLRVDGNAFPFFADPSTSAAGAAEWGVALNWYLNSFARIMNGYEHTSFNMAAPRFTLHGENVIISRLQLAF